ncbi:MAG: LCP family protein [Selenomonas sp.]|nr:LCP family protein [Selenomonas sp.]
MRRTRRQKRSFRRVKWLAFFLLLFVGIGLVWGFGGLHGRGSRGAAPGLMAGEHTVHVMILGVDQRADDVGRSDTLMVATLDTESGKGALLSVPRDTRLAIDGHGYDKANHAYAFGGHALSMSTVENLLGVPMDHYLIINTSAFERIIDAIGGVDINVEKRMHYEDPWDDNGGLVIDLYPGEQHMDGKKAIQYVRYRDGEGDIGRIGRQQKFMQAVLAKVISPEILPRLPKLIEEVSSAVKTDMSLTEMLDFAQRLKDIHDAGLSADMVPGEPAYYQDISYWIPDIVATRQMLAEEIGIEFTPELRTAAEDAAAEYKESLPKGLTISGSEQRKADEADSDDENKDEPMKPSEITVMVINSSGINGAGAQVADILKRKGFRISSVETGRTDAREKTSITTSSRNTDVFYGMPFPCIIMDGGSSNQAVVNIGRDYKKK